jgi:hypothetical protein
MEQFKMITKENDLAQSLITAMLTERIQPYIPHWDKHGIDIPVFYIAGGALWDSPPNDIDVYLPQGTSFSSMVNKIFEITSKEMSEKSVTKSVHSSPNALTLRLSEIKVPVQICSYQNHRSRNWLILLIFHTPNPPLKSQTARLLRFITAMLG